MATLGRSLRRMRAHHPERTVLAAAGAVAVVYLGLHQEVLLHLNLLVGP